MQPDFKVSVVTPVYNAGPFVRRAVEAAVSQPETGEVILVEDCSPDNSLEVCRALEAEFPKVRLVRHPDGRNHGAGESRNLGIREARYDFLAFADADNFYLPNRFARDRELLTSDPTLDGVYNAQGIHYYSEEARKLFHSTGFGGDEFLSVSAAVPPDEFWQVMLGQHPTASMICSLGIDAITLRTKAIQKVGLFDPALKLDQDVDFFVRMAIACRMAAGVIDRPVAVRGVHGRMRSTVAPAARAGFRRQCWASLRQWVGKNVRNPGIRFAFERAFFNQALSWRPRWRSRCAFIALILRYPRLLPKPYGFFDLNLLELFGRNWATLHAVSAKNRVVRMFPSLAPKQ